MRKILPIMMIAACLYVFFRPGVLTAAEADRSRGFFPVSVWYPGGKARAPMLEAVTPASRSEWKKDLEQIKTLGFNTVRTWVEWAACEKEEGRYDFSALTLLSDLAREVGLRVIVQVYIDSAPDWVRRRFPDGRFVASNGVAVEPQAAPGLCFDHPGVRERVLKFFTAAARALKDKPAFYGWDLWSEPHIINWSEVYYVGDLRYVEFCYCANTQKRFREWLLKKYGSLEALNGAWYRSFRDWREVEPPRYGTILTFTDYIDWKQFISDKLAEDLAMKAAAVKAVLPEAVVTSHSAAPGLFTRPDWAGTPDDRKMNNSVDFYGASIYPKHAWTTRPWSPFYRSSGMDFVRSMGIRNGGFYIGELQAGYGVFGMKVSQPVAGSDLRDWMWTAAAYGARAVNIYAYYPMSSGYEAGGYGLVELDGKLTERAVAAGHVAAVISRNAGLFLRAKPPRAEVAVLYNPLANMVGGQQSFTSEGQPVGVNSLSESLQGIHRAFYEKGVAVDFLHVDDLGTARASAYKLLVVPYPVMISRPNLAKLVDFVKDGGAVVAEARCGWVDERGYSSPVIPGGGLDQVLGCRESNLSPVRKTGVMAVKTGHPSLPFLKRGDRLDTVFFAESFEVFGKDSVVLAEYENGEPAMVYARHGRGQALIAGSFLGLAYHHFLNPANAAFFAGLAAWLGVEAPVVVKPGRPDDMLEARVLEGDGYTLFFAFNRGDREAAGDFRVRFPAGRVAVVDLETGADVPTAREADRVLVRGKLAAGEVRVMLLKRLE